MKIMHIPDVIRTGKWKNMPHHRCITCYYNDGYLNSYKFEQFTGFTPHDVISDEMQIKRDIANVIDEFDNIYQEGFKIVGYGNDEYYHSHIIIEDPRGFLSHLVIQNLNYLVIDKHINIVDDIIQSKLKYGVDTNYHILLIPPNYK